MQYPKVLLIPMVVLLFTANATNAMAQQPPSGPSEAQKQALVGKWEWTLAVGPMRKKVSMEVSQKEGKLVAVVKLDDGTTLESKDLMLKDERVQFTVRSEQNGRAISMTHEGTLKDGKITGTAKMSGGPMEMSSKWDASKIKKK